MNVPSKNSVKVDEAEFVAGQFKSDSAKHYVLLILKNFHANMFQHHNIFVLQIFTLFNI